MVNYEEVNPNPLSILCSGGQFYNFVRNLLILVLSRGWISFVRIKHYLITKIRELRTKKFHSIGSWWTFWWLWALDVTALVDS